MTTKQRRQPPSKVKRWGFRIAAILLGLLPFAVAESWLRATGRGLVSEAIDPYVGFDAVRPLFVLDDEQQHYVTDPARHAYFRPESFAARKSPGEFRIFCLGGSTVQGRPYAIETSFTTWLELSLQHADPTRQWQVVNCGGVSYASYRLVPILEELLQHAPDMFIIYTGHNEFLEDRTYESVKSTPRSIARLHGWASRLRLYNVARGAWAGSQRAERASPTKLPAEVVALLDYHGGLDDYYRDDTWKLGATEHYGFNLRSMIGSARRHNVPLILVNPVANLRDCPPFKYEPGPDLTRSEREEFTSLWERAGQSNDQQERVALLERAVQLDSRHAAALYSLAKSYDELGRVDEARRMYVSAKDEDICPLRMIESQYRVLAEVAEQTRTPLVDARGHFEGESQVGIPGNDLLLDHVHPSINGHQRIARLLLEQMIEMGIARPREDWKVGLSDRYAEHLASLHAAYFVRGTQRLKGLIMWTQGRAEGGPTRTNRRQPNQDGQ